MAETIRITEENRHLYGGDFRTRRSLTLPNGQYAPGKPINKRSLIPTEPGAIIYKKNPEMRHAIIAVELSNFPAANTQRLQYVDIGFKFCSFDEWDLASRFKDIWEKSADGKIVSNAGGNYALALMWCPAELVEDREKEFFAYSDEIEETFEQKLSKTRNEFNALTGQSELTQKRFNEAVERHLEMQERLTPRRLERAMPGINVIVPPQWKNKIVGSDRNAFEAGAVELPLVANLAIPDGTPVNIATNGQVAEASATLAPNGLSLGDCVNGAVAGAEVGNVIEMSVGDRFYGRLTEAIPATWYGTVVGFVKGAGNAGYTLATSGFITGTNIFKIHSIKDAVVGDTNAIVEIVKSA
jgi:hypothetical protein